MKKGKRLGLAKKIRSWAGGVCGLLVVLSGSCWLSGIQPGLPVTVLAAESDVPSYVHMPGLDGYMVGGESSVENIDGHATTGTEFYLRIENPRMDDSDDDVYYRGQYVGGSASGSTPGSLSSGENLQSGYMVGSMPSGMPAEMESGYPKTGDYGPDKTVILWAALVFGAGYLCCDYYEKRYEEIRM